MQVHQRVDEVLLQVDLTERASDLVGVPGATGLPTEARKRLTIAVELVASPPVVFMDEPTSGVQWQGRATIRDVPEMMQLCIADLWCQELPQRVVHFRMILGSCKSWGAVQSLHAWFIGCPNLANPVCFLACPLQHI